MLKLDLDKVTAKVRARFYGSGSVTAETVEAGCESVSVELAIESTESPDAVAKLVRVSEAGCFVLQTLRQPVPVSTRLLLNGGPIDYGSSPSGVG